MRSKMRVVQLLLACIVVISLTILPSNTEKAFAHATLLETNPESEGLIDNVPEYIELKFNEPVRAKYSNITIYDDEGKKLTELSPKSSGSSPTLKFSSDTLEYGTYVIEWHAISADGHEVSDDFLFSIGEKTANEINTSQPFYKDSNNWFGLTRFISEGLIILLIGFFAVSEFTRRKHLITPQSPITRPKFVLPVIGLLILSLVTYFTTLNSSVISDILTLDIDILTEFPFILVAVGLIILLILELIKGMQKSWYKVIAVLIIIVLSMSGHVWSQTMPIWSIIIRIVHLTGISLWLGTFIYLFYYIRHNNQQDIKTLHSLLFKINISAVIFIVISGVLMAIDETNILDIWTNIQTWSIFLIIKVIGTITMAIFGFYQTTYALGKENTINKKSLYVESSIGIILIFIGIMMSQITIP